MLLEEGKIPTDTHQSITADLQQACAKHEAKVLAQFHAIKREEVRRMVLEK